MVNCRNTVIHDKKLLLTIRRTVRR